VRPVDLAGFYAAIANEGKLPTPHVVESITKDGTEIYKANDGTRPLASVDPAAIFQLRTFLQGVVARGTAARMSSLSNFIGGKTGTSDDFNDAWFAGFSNDVTVVVWVGYDNAKGKRTLGGGQSGARVAIPIFEPIMKAAWANIAKQTPLPRPSPEAARHLITIPIDLNSGQRFDSRGGETFFDGRGARAGYVSGAFMEYFRRDDSGQVNDTQDRMASSGYGGYGNRDGQSSFTFNNPFESWFAPRQGGPSFNDAPSYVRPPPGDARSRGYVPNRSGYIPDRSGF
jgi:membrane carboxypeptidase/penicillin-binding protein